MDVVESVPAQPLSLPRPPANDPAEVAPRPIEVPAWPSPSAADVGVDGSASRAGSTPISIATASGDSDSRDRDANLESDSVGEVLVEVFDRTKTNLGASAFSFDVDRSDGGREASKVRVELDYSGFAGAFGADYASRLVLRRYPSCVLKTPEDERCWAHEALEAKNDLTAERLTVDLVVDPALAPGTGVEQPAEPQTNDGSEAGEPPIPSPPTGPGSTTTSTIPGSVEEPANGSEGAGPAKEPMPSSPSTTEPDTQSEVGEPPPTTTSTEATAEADESLEAPDADEGAQKDPFAGGSVYALSAGGAGTSSNYNATSLAQASRWQAGGSSGDANYGYPLVVPSATVGPTPDLSLAYSSQAVDGMTPDENGQPGVVGLGWDISGLGYIERVYMGCGAEAPVWLGGDLCWKQDNATIVLNGKSSELVPAGAGQWKLKDDPGWRVSKVTSAQPNGDNDREAWIVQSPDGMTYKFGQGYEEGTNAATNSTWTVPVFAKSSSAPCYNATPNNSWCDQAWRWNLDQIIDPNGNQTTVFWFAETNHYARRGIPSAVSAYESGGYPWRVEYSKRPGQVSAPTSVQFNYVDRCVASMTGGACPPKTPANASQYPDVPVDLICTSSTYCADKYSPSFFVAKRLHTIVTSTKTSGGTNRAVDLYSLSHTLPDPADGTSEKLWLDQIQRTGKPGWVWYGQPATDATSMEPVEFYGTWLDNRAENSISSKMLRLAVAHEELGAMVWFSYGQPGHSCTTFSGWDTNSQYCFPVYFDPDGGTAGWATMNKFVVTQTLLVDGTGGSPAQAINYTYGDNPAWHHNGSPLIPDNRETWSEWRGHSKVTTTNGDTASIELFYRGMHGDKLTGGATKSVSINDANGGSVVDSDWMAGYLREERVVYEGTNSSIIATIHSYGHVVTKATSGTLISRQIRETAADTRRQAASGVIYTKVTSSYDSYGLPEVVNDQGDLATGTDNRCTTLDYDRGLVALWTYRLDRPSRTTLDNNCASPYNRVTTVGYFDTGNPQSVKQYYDATLTDTPSIFVETRYSYDSYGRVTGVRTPRGNLTTTSYSPTTNGLTTSVAVNGPTGLTSSSILEPFRALLTEATDPNGKVIASTYDGLGRLKTVQTPIDTTSTPSYKFSYDATKTHESRIRSYERLDGSNYVETWTLYDGFGRDRETQTSSPSGTGRVVTATRYDDQGRVVSESDPFFNSGTPGHSGLVNATGTSLPNDTLSYYDELSRSTTVDRRKLGTTIGSTTSSYSGFDARTTSPDGRSRRVRTNAFGETTRIEEMAGTGASVYATTTHSIGTAGTLNSITDDAGNTTTYGYDNLGRRTSTDDPDAGTSSSTYDNDGNTETATDATGAITRTAFDVLGRPTHRYAGSSTADPLLASWTYWTSTDTPATNKGLAKSTTSYDDTGNGYVSSIDAYDALGRPTATSVTVPASAGTGLAGTYTSTASYDAAGNVLTAGLPAVADLPAETITHGYTPLGLPSTTSGTTTTATPPTSVPPGWSTQYVAATSYDNAGRLVSETSGSAPSHIQRTWTYGDPSGRVSETATGVLGGATIARDKLKYTKDGLVASVQDDLAGQNQCFTYDSQARLSAAWTSDTCGSTDYSTWSHTTADSTVGPNPYKQTFTYDKAHNLTSITNGTTTPVTTTYSPNGEDPSGQVLPHAVGAVSTPGQTTETIEYDEGGSVTERTIGSATTTYDWNHSRKLSAATTPDGTTSFVYDADGNRILRTEPNGTTTLYLGGHELTRQPDGTTTAQRYYANAVRTVNGLTWLLGDRQGSAEIAVNATTPTTVARQRYLPYGAPRGPGHQLPTERDFLGKTKDDTTGLVLLGARYYDPGLARFVSTDPLADLGNPQTLNAYGYAGNNPTTNADPTGLFFGSLIKNMLASASNLIKKVKKQAQKRSAAALGKQILVSLPGVTSAPSLAERALTKLKEISETPIPFTDGWSATRPGGGTTIGDVAEAGVEAAPGVVKELSGWNDLVDCSNGSVGGCLWTVVAFASVIPPVGVLGKAGNATKAAKAAGASRAARSGKAATPAGKAAKGLKASKAPQSIARAESAADFARMTRQLQFDEAASVFNRSGGLQSSVINRSSPIIRGPQIGNQQVVKSLTADGSNIADWAKYTTQSFQSPSGPFQVHFYRNSVTGAVNYANDYKVVFNGPR